MNGHNILHRGAQLDMPMDELKRVDVAQHRAALPQKSGLSLI
jgi:hypothetical protein